MSLIKSFNINYLKENIKKSKGIISLMLIIVPVLTLLSIVFIYNKDFTYILTNSEIIFPNYLGMYIIPYVISIALFGYVYKKSSVDLINSMPLNRKTIFITNTIGGILLITLIQLITLVFCLICNSLISTIIIFPEMLIDIFVAMWLAYVFVFSATNLAMTLSGTIFAQLVLTMVIIFLVPFCMFTFQFIERDTSNSQSDDTFKFEALQTHSQDDKYTLPFNIINGFENSYSDVSNTKMLVLALLYFVIGLHLFQKRKMENAEESFRSNKIHLIVKALTVFPMIVIVNIINEGIRFNVFAIALIVIYYFVYDFIVKRKIKLWLSILSLILTLGISQLVILGVQKVPYEYSKIEKEDIDKIEISWGFENEVKELYIDNQSIINDIYDYSKIGAEINYRYYNNYTSDRTERDNLLSINEYVILKNGKKYNTSSYINKDDFEKIIDELEKDSDYVKKVRDLYIKNGVYTIDDRCLVAQQEQLNKLIEEKFSTMTLKELSNMTSNVNIQKKYYKNHNIISFDIPANIDEEILKVIIDEEKNSIKNLINKDEADQDYVTYCLYGDEKYGYDTKKYSKFGSYFNNTESEISQFINDNLDEDVDVKQPMYLINVMYRYKNFDTYLRLYFFTNKKDELNNIIEKESEYYVDYDSLEDDYIYNVDYTNEVFTDYNSDNYNTITNITDNSILTNN